jgi:TonB family protein
MRKIVLASLLLLSLFGLPVSATQISSQESVSKAVVQAPKATIGPVRVLLRDQDRLAAGHNAIQEVPPRYPADAKAARVQGTVILSIVVGTDGSVASVDVKSGPEMLVPAAIEAAKQWKFQPSEFNGKPCEVALDLNFTFSIKN